ncbi:hypothetical protein SARC_11928 [Sphaeroforma arctica JP610]|uniref:Uncharacterized protein n=1 Tax=Sphaeroforma arctica JP610 TaxID=667725 RepID=A0A0L0FGH1_9EUKA|nr:hypothetical protein SARC_11928 [Sphaeroforma arctica JP610]KNC75551.1 hypothetical protein SARC_11928 [Sphaeroforma arctica JP610]|eukprot:XP_014149453.1 hypothetical protein SARC_11928 [Sphaeroforma arctica JP610]
MQTTAATEAATVTVVIKGVDPPKHVTMTYPGDVPIIATAHPLLDAIASRILAETPDTIHCKGLLPNLVGPILILYLHSQDHSCTRAFPGDKHICQSICDGLH